MTAVRAFAISSLFLAFGSIGCAAEQQVLKTSRYSLSHPDYWKVQSVAKKDGEATRLSVGKYSDTVINSGEMASQDAAYESSQADVDVSIYAWPASGEAEPTKWIVDKLREDLHLQLQKQGRIRQPGDECGREFKRKFTVLQKEVETVDLASQPGHRLILVAGENQGTLLGVVARVPYEQDGGLYCHNLRNMRLQLQNVLDAVTLNPPWAAPATPPPPQ